MDHKIAMTQIWKSGIMTKSYYSHFFLKKTGEKLLLIIVLILSLSNIYTYYVYTNNLTKLENNYDVIIDEIQYSRKILNTSLIGFSSSILRLKTMDFYRWNTTYPPNDFGQPVSVIYIFNNNSTLLIDLKIQGLDGFYIPLTIQKGNAFSLNDATVSILDSNQKYAPILYSNNISSDKKIEVFITEKGWYTISLTGKWTFTGGTDDVGILYKDHNIVVLPFRVKADISVRSSFEEYDFFANKYYITFSIQ